MNKVCKLAIQS